MQRQCFAIGLLCTMIAWAGCGSSDSADQPRSMDQIAAGLDEQVSAGAVNAMTDTAAADSSSTHAAAGYEPASAASATPAAADPSLPSKRGFALTDWSNEAAYVLVKADVATTADALAAAWNGKVVKDVFGKNVDENSTRAVVYQLAGHPWSIFACDGSQLESLTPALSRDADVLAFWNSDFNGWAGVQLHRGGEEVEAIHWGGVDEKLGEDADASKWQAEGQVTRTNDGFTFTDAFLFRGKLRQVTKEELQKGEAIIDDMFKHYDAYLPDVEQMPWFDYETKTVTSPLGKGAFAGVHAVESP